MLTAQFAIYIFIFLARLRPLDSAFRVKQMQKFVLE